jgi:hypothetical protein
VTRPQVEGLESRSLLSLTMNNCMISGNDLTTIRTNLKVTLTDCMISGNDLTTIRTNSVAGYDLTTIRTNSVATSFQWGIGR